VDSAPAPTCALAQFLLSIVDMWINHFMENSKVGIENVHALASNIDLPL